ncbi:MAG: DNA replication/repair protein RecF [Aeriscardovia sp.]|nr:DNA replication/repair protein RecF [Aeriscardovia sp.]
MADYVSRLALDHVRSWSSLVLDFDPGVTVLLGRNGIGKTNVVEALEFLSIGSSSRSSSSKFLIQKGQSAATIRARADVRSGSHIMQVTIPQRGVLRSRLDNGKSQYFRDIAGLLRVISFSPSDQQLASGEPARRRRFLDQTSIMMMPQYYSLLQQCQQIAHQRIAVLKQIKEHTSEKWSESELEIWTDQFIQLGIKITQARARAVSALNPLFSQLYRDFSGHNDEAQLVYQPSLSEVIHNDAAQETLYQQLHDHFIRIQAGEIARTTNLIGPQRDELLLLLDGNPAREFASNGELWTLGLAMRLAQFRFITENSLIGYPILVLDDVFAQLDNKRRERIFAFAEAQQQVFITAAAEGDVPHGNGHYLNLEEFSN